MENEKEGTCGGLSIGRRRGRCLRSGVSLCFPIGVSSFIEANVFGQVEVDGGVKEIVILCRVHGSEM